MIAWLMRLATMSAVLSPRTGSPESATPSGHCAVSPAASAVTTPLFLVSFPFDSRRFASEQPSPCAR